MNNTMPKVDFEKITSKAAGEVIRSIVKNDGTLYSSKPVKANGKAKYIWRMVALMVSPKRAHQAMPVTAIFDLQDYFESMGADPDESYDMAKEYVKASKGTIAEIQDAFGYCEGSLPKRYSSVMKAL